MLMNHSATVPGDGIRCQPLRDGARASACQARDACCGRSVQDSCQASGLDTLGGSEILPLLGEPREKAAGAYAYLPLCRLNGGKAV